MDNKINRLLEIAESDDKVKLKVLRNAVLTCLQDYEKESIGISMKGKEADPLALTEIRTNAYPFTKKIIDMSTPADESGYIGRVVETEADELRHYHAICPICQAPQVMHFGRFAWPKACKDPREIIRKGIGTFYEVGDALIQIREKEYYRDILGFETFEEYCKKKWGMGKSQAYRLINAKQIADNVFPPMGDTPEPKINELHAPEPEEMTERTLRPLAAVPPEDQPTVYHLAKETAPEGKLTAAHVEKTVREIRGENPKTAAGQRLWNERRNAPSTAADPLIDYRQVAQVE